MTDKWYRGLPESQPMQIADPLRPYVALLRWALMMVLACGIFVAGCSRGENKMQAQADKAVAKAERERDEAKQSKAKQSKAVSDRQPRGSQRMRPSAELYQRRNPAGRAARKRMEGGR